MLLNNNNINIKLLFTFIIQFVIIVNSLDQNNNNRDEDDKLILKRSTQNNDNESIGRTTGSIGLQQLGFLKRIFTDTTSASTQQQYEDGRDRPFFGRPFPSSYNINLVTDRKSCPLCDSSVYSYCSDKLLHDACCCLNPYEDQLPYQCRFADCSFLHANSCREHRLITRCCCNNLYLAKNN